MNLKESFRYQNFLGTMMNEAMRNISNTENAFKVTKTHLKSKANPDATDVVEEVEKGEGYFPIDEIISLTKDLIAEKERLTVAINKAKASSEIDIDAAIETNKFRQTVSGSLKRLFSKKPYKRTEEGTGYKFNAEGNQSPYFYDVEVVAEDDFDRMAAKEYVRELDAVADEASSDVDAIMINTELDFKPVFDVNASFDDIINEREHSLA